MIQKKKTIVDSKIGLAVQLVLMFLCGAQLINTDAYFVDYAFLMIVTAICCYKNCKAKEFLFGKNHKKYYEVLIYLFAALFSCMVSLANYRVWVYIPVPADYGFWYKAFLCLLVTIVLFAGSFIAFWNIFNAVFSNLRKLLWKRREKDRINPYVIFLVSFVLLVLTRWIVLHYCQYPGELSPDSISQMEQLMSGTYSNHHPFYHTMVIKLFITIGLHLFHDINAAVATYSFFQILFTAMCFSFAVSTMARMKAPRWMIIASMLFFILMPYHLLFAITMWKDVMFGCFVLLLVIFFYRCMKDIGNKILDYVMLAISSIGICLFRSNGFLVFVVLTVLFVVLWKNKNIKILILFVAVIVVSFVMKHSVLAGLGVTQPDTIESLSVPAQQIARVISEGGELNEEEREALGEIIDIDRVGEEYLAHISDPIKDLVREKGNQNLIKEEKWKYLKLYLTLGIKHPKAYVTAWIDLTRGYWNAGYEYPCWYCGVYENDLGIVSTIRSRALTNGLQAYSDLFTNVQGLRLFMSIGLFVWIDLVMLLIALFRKDKDGAFAALPVLIIVATLLVATPVFAEYRYIYAVFCTLPMVMAIALRPEKETTSFIMMEKSKEDDYASNMHK